MKSYKHIYSPSIAVLKRGEVCPMPYALCPMPARAPHVTEKGYSCTFTTKNTQTSVRLK